MNNLEEFEDKKVKITLTNGDTISGIVSEYFSREDNEPEYDQEIIVIDDSEYERPVALLADRIKHIEVQ